MTLGGGLVHRSTTPCVAWKSEAVIPANRRKTGFCAPTFELLSWFHKFFECMHVDLPISEVSLKSAIAKMLLQTCGGCCPNSPVVCVGWWSKKTSVSHLWLLVMPSFSVKDS